mgnify:CR=1 FL=1
MSAVIGSGAAKAAMPLLACADEARVFAWRDGGRPVTVAGFLGDVEATAAVLPAAPAAVNLCENRYAFIVAFAALIARGQCNLLPSSRAQRAVDEVLAQHPGSYTLGDVAPEPIPPRFIPLPATGNAATARQVAVEADARVAIGFTSGSTGQPKANPKRWASLCQATRMNVAAIADAIGLADGAIAHVVATVPPQHMYGIEMSVLLPLQGPFAVHEARPLLPADVAAALAGIPAPRVLVTTPVHLRALLDADIALPRIACITSATAPLPAELARQAEDRFGAPLLELFGSTETCVIASRRCALDEDWRLYPGTDLHPQPDGTRVEAAHFDAPVLLQDLIELLPDRRFRVHGRHADMVEIAGKRASLGDLTRRLLALPGVKDAVVVQLDETDARGVRRIAALVVAPEREEAELLDGLRASIDPVFLPRPLRKVARLPRNETGKLPRAAVLRALVGAP